MTLHEEITEFYLNLRDKGRGTTAYGETLEKFGRKKMRAKCGKCEHDLDSHGFSTGTCFECGCEKWESEDEFGDYVREARDEKERMG